MDGTASILLGSASVALIHTAIGVDHYLPFVALGHSEGWSLRRTLGWTTVCGIGHVLSSVVLAALAGGLGWATGQFEQVEQTRGDLAAYLLIALGLIYVLVDVLMGNRHTHAHIHADGTVHSHTHQHGWGGDPGHDGTGHHLRHERTLWAMFIIFVLGPCEPLMALMFVPALQHNLVVAASVIWVFSVVTLLTMLTLVTVGYLGVGLVNFAPIHRWRHRLAGLAISVSGVLILLGL